MGLFSELNDCVKDAGYSFANWDCENRFWCVITKSLQSRINSEFSEIFTKEDKRTFAQLDDPGEIMRWIDEHTELLGISIRFHIKRMKNEIKENKDEIMRINQVAREREKPKKPLSTEEELKGCAIDAGIQFTDSKDERRFLDIVVSELEVRIGEKISAGCTREELAEFDRCNDSKQAGKWLEEHVPDYRLTVVSENTRIKEEIRENATYITEKKKKEGVQRLIEIFKMIR